MTLSSIFKPMKSRLVPAIASGLIASGLIIGSISMSKAQSVLFTNTDTISTGAATVAVPPTGGSVTHTYPSGDSYYINSAGATDASVKDGGNGVGADIRLSVAGNGIRLVSSQNTVFNVSNDVYTFYTTIHDQASGLSGVLYTTFTLNTNFNEGTSSTTASNASFGSVQGGVLGGNSLVLGGHAYTASNFSFTPPSAPPQGGGTSDTDGAFSEHITAFATTPEPGAIATMIGMGIGGSTFLLRRKRK